MRDWQTARSSNDPIVGLGREAQAPSDLRRRLAAERVAAGPSRLSVLPIALAAAGYEIDARSRSAEDR